MAKTESKGLNVDVYRSSLSPTQISELRRTLAKRANQRLVRLERATSKISDERFNTIGAAPIAYEYLKKTGRRRFTEKLNAGLTYDQERTEVIKLQAFLSSKSSTVQGLRDIERRRIETFESGRYGSYADTGKARKKINFASTKEFYDFFQSSTFRDLRSAGFSSEQIVEEYDTALERYEGAGEEAIKALEEALEIFREKGKVTLKDLRAAAGGKPLR